MKLKQGDLIFTDRGTVYKIFKMWHKFKPYYIAQDIEELIKNHPNISECKKYCISNNSNVDFDRDGITLVVRKYFFGMFTKEIKNQRR
jgi:hypothetical protein